MSATAAGDEATAASPLGGLYEHWYGTEDIDRAIRYWRQLGYEPSAQSRLGAEQAEALYGGRGSLESVRLRHQGTDRQGLIRLHRFEAGMGPGLGFSHALATGSRWSGFYSRDILAVQDAYRDQAALSGERWKVSDVARLFISATTPSFYDPFIGIRETTVTGSAHRHAFLQRVGFDRPGFGSFAEQTPLPVTESTHGNVVLRVFDDHEFYARGLGLAVQTPVQSIDWTVTAVRNSLELKEGESFVVIVYQAPGEPSGFLRVYGSAEVRDNQLDQSRPGQLGACGYSYRYPAGSLPARRAAVQKAGAVDVTPILENEFGERSFSFNAPDGYFWNLVEER